jgi:hypothetical protein
MSHRYWEWGVIKPTVCWQLQRFTSRAPDRPKASSSACSNPLTVQVAAWCRGHQNLDKSSQAKTWQGRLLRIHALKEMARNAIRKLDVHSQFPAVSSYKRSSTLGLSTTCAVDPRRQSPTCCFNCGRPPEFCKRAENTYGRMMEANLHQTDRPGMCIILRQRLLLQGM